MSYRPEMLAADHIRDLAIGFTTSELITQPAEHEDGTWRPVTKLHAVTHPPLLDQLEEAITGGSSLSDDDAARGGFGSSPAAHLEAVDVLARIRREACDLAASLDIPVYRRTPTKAVLSAISGKVGDKPHEKVKRWWVSARLTTQWDTRPFQPAGVPCMNCWELGSLRLDVTNDLGRCTECMEVWDGPTGFANLAHHVKWCADHEIVKARHWLHDDDGELIECVECLTTRDQYTEWKMTKPTRNAKAKTG